MLEDLRAARDEARLAVNALDKAIERDGELEEGERASAVTILREAAERHLRNALSKVSPANDAGATSR